MTPVPLLLLCFSHLILLLLAHAAARSSSRLQMSVGLSLSPRNTKIAIPAAPVSANYFSYFVPILSSPSFNSSDSSQSPGFSLGFLFYNSGIYLAVCGGISGNLSNSSSSVYLNAFDDRTYATFNLTDSGYAVPVWIANGGAPLASVNASLTVVAVQGGRGTTSSKQLQLKDYNDMVLWRLPVTNDVGVMEMQDTGSLTIYDSINTTNVVWESPRDTLLLEDKLTVGKQLTSNDGSYSARMEQGGLVLYANIKFNYMGVRPTPYWAIPATLSLEDSPFNVSNKVMSSPCRSPTSNDTGAHAIVKNASFNIPMRLQLNPASCEQDAGLSATSTDEESTGNLSPGPFSFVQLKNDGWLHIFAEYSSGWKEIRFWDYVTLNSILSTFEPILQVAMWNTCFVPLACGPLGVCTPYASSPCSCPASSEVLRLFKPQDDGDLHKGCSRVLPLPQCTKDEHVHTTHFLQLNHTSSVFLFSGLVNSSSVLNHDVQTCKNSCSSNCSCNGFFYQANIQACFFITEEVTLLNLTSDINRNHTTIDRYYVSSWSSVDIRKRDYVTYLKVTTDNQTSTSPPAGVLRSPGARLARSSVIAIAVASSIAACIGLGLAMLLLYTRETKRRLLSKQARQAALEEEELSEVLPLLPSRFSYQDLHQATNGFSNLLGAGGCGSVYAGMLPDGRKIAVKTLDFVMKGQSKQFLAEVATIGQTSHHNIVRLVGFCWEVSSRLLVYEYMERGSLDHWLFRKPGSDGEGAAAPLLDWQTRYKVVLGIIRGLYYLHDECPQPILHFDLKPQNILLDREFVAKLADFGMSRLMQRDVSEVVTGVRGTPGYIAPEWLSHGAVSKKSDIYSMGMVMLEMVGGRKNVDHELLNNVLNAPEFNNNSTPSGSGQHEEWHFPSWAARKCAQGLEMEVVDKRLEGAFNEEQARRLIYTAFWCIQEDAGMRPYVATVLQWLEGSLPVKQPPFASAAHTSSRSKPSPSSSSHRFSSLGITTSSSFQLQ